MEARFAAVEEAAAVGEGWLKGGGVRRTGRFRQRCNEKAKEP